MIVARDLAELRRFAPGVRLAFVPTMGNLHDGHMALVDLAHKHADRVAVSVFVNRLQFAPGEDFEHYPRTFAADCEKLAGAGVELVFAPDERVLYPAPQRFLVEPPPIARDLEGRYREGFFRGVATVVLKLLNCVQPQVAVFGKKDFQQLLLVRDMVSQFNLPIEIVAGDTVREADGLAMSSRNGYLSPEQRREAPRLHRVLRDVSTGHLDAAQAVRELEASGWLPDYVEVRRRADLEPVSDTDTQRIVLGAARLGATRLVDNVEF
jgi:pantoate--beta-alanine ligase